MHERAIDADRFPRFALYAAGGLVATVVIGTGAVRTGLIAGMPTTMQARAAAHATALEIRTLRFLDNPDGSVKIEDAADGSTAGTIAPGTTNGFVRGVMRGLARDRKLSHIGREAPFTLTRWSDGGLTLDDPSTRRHVELGSFGPTNRAAFRLLLKSGAHA